MFLKIFAVVAFFAYSEAKFYTDCGSKLATVINVGVNGCAEDATECVLKRNTNVTISVDFTPNKDIKKIETIVHGIIMNLPVPFPLPQPDACKNSGLTCPLKAGAEANYKASFPVLKSYPKVKVDVKWELKNENEEDLVCVTITAKIN